MLNYTSDSIGNRRSACDRCRRHKLRCEKGNTGRCQRCEKAHSQCLMAPALRSGRPVQVSNSPVRLMQVCPVLEDHGHPNVVADNTPDVFMRPPASLEAPLEDQGYTAGLETRRLLSPTTINDFNDIWSHSFPADEPAGVGNEQIPCSPPLTPSNEALGKLADLQSKILVDLEAVKHCRTADKCPEAINATTSITGQNVLVGRVLDHSTALIDILEYFQPSCTDSECHKLLCDTPITVTLVSCYVSLVRIYRTIFSCLLDSLPYLSGIQHPIPQLFPGMHLGGFKLEARVDLQVQILVKISEDMLERIETRFGLPGAGPAAGESSPRLGKAARLLQVMLDEEASEQPELYEPRGYCRPMKELLVSLRNSDRRCSSH